MYKVYIERAAERDLKKLSLHNFNAIIPFIKRLTENPRPVNSRKILSSKKDWRIRVGDYRVIYEVDDLAKIVRIMRVKHRREVYR